MPTVEQLNQRNDSCDLECVEKCRALYEGGDEFRAKLTAFLPQRPAEPPQQYALRQREAHYQNYIGPIIDYFASMLFTSRPAPAARKTGKQDTETDPGEYYSGFRDDCDRRGTDVDAFFKERITEAMVAKRAWVWVQQPANADTEVRTRAEFERLKLGDFWLAAVDYEEVRDWETDESGNLDWAIVHEKFCRRAGPSDERKTVTERWYYLTKNEIETFELVYPKDKPPRPSDEVPSVGTEPHRLGKVPLFCIELPKGLWVGNRLESPQVAHFRCSNAQDWGMSRTCYAMPVYKVEDPDEFNARMGAGYGITIKPTEDVEWTAPPGDHFLALEGRIQTHKDEIFRIAHQMALGVENNSAAVGRSAESKAVDAQATRVVLVAYAKEVKEVIARIYDAISQARGDELEWTVGGLDEFAATDVMGFLEALALVQDVGGIPSRTANIQLKTKLAESLLTELDQKTKAQIREEIEDGTPEPMDPQELELEKAHALAAKLTGPNADGGTNGGAGAPGGRKPPSVARGGSQRPAVVAAGKKPSN